jgi:hypothetical protein
MVRIRCRYRPNFSGQVQFCSNRTESNRTKPLLFEPIKNVEQTGFVHFSRLVFTVLRAVTSFEGKTTCSSTLQDFLKLTCGTDPKRTEIFSCGFGSIRFQSLVRTNYQWKVAHVLSTLQLSDVSTSSIHWYSIHWSLDWRTTDTDIARRRYKRKFTYVCLSVI